MPAHLIPHLSPSHRHTVLALYRALLSQIFRLPATLSSRSNRPNSNPRTLLQNLVHNRFHQSRYLTSPHLLRPRFLLAYEALDHLDDAVAGDETALRDIGDLLAKCSLTSTSSPRKHLDARTYAERRKARRKAGLKLDSAPSVFDRPKPLSEIRGGRRKVPVLFTANHIPVLRLGKPQPHSLSGYLQARIRQRQKRQNLLMRLAGEVEVARREEEWDGLLGMEASRGRRDVGWTEVLNEEMRVVRSKLARERKVNLEVGRKMQEIVDRETELAEKEARERGENGLGQQKNSRGVKGRRKAAVNEKKETVLGIGVADTVPTTTPPTTFRTTADD